MTNLLEKYQPKTKWVCFLPWASEFGWYVMNHVKRVHGYNHPNKIACIKHDRTLRTDFSGNPTETFCSHDGCTVRINHNVSEESKLEAIDLTESYIRKKFNVDPVKVDVL